MKLRGNKDLSIASVGKYGTLQEFSFFDKVRARLGREAGFGVWGVVGLREQGRGRRPPACPLPGGLLTGAPAGAPRAQEPGGVRELPTVHSALQPGAGVRLGAAAAGQPVPRVRPGPASRTRCVGGLLGHRLLSELHIPPCARVSGCEVPGSPARFLQRARLQRGWPRFRLTQCPVTGI